MPRQWGMPFRLVLLPERRPTVRRTVVVLGVLSVVGTAFLIAARPTHAAGDKAELTPGERVILEKLNELERSIRRLEPRLQAL